MVSNLYWIAIGLISCNALVYSLRKRWAFGIYLAALLAGSLLQNYSSQYFYWNNKDLALQIYEILTILMCAGQIIYVFWSIGKNIIFETAFLLAILGGAWGFGCRAAMKTVSVYSTEIIYLFSAIFVSTVLFAFYRSKFGWKTKFQPTARDWELIPLFIYSMVYISTYRFINLDIDQYFTIQGMLLVVLYSAQLMIGTTLLIRGRKMDIQLFDAAPGKKYAPYPKQDETDRLFI